MNLFIIIIFVIFRVKITYQQLQNLFQISNNQLNQIETINQLTHLFIHLQKNTNKKIINMQINQQPYQSSIILSNQSRKLSPKVNMISTQITHSQPFLIKRHHLDDTQMKLALQYKHNDDQQNYPKKYHTKGSNWKLQGTAGASVINKNQNGYGRNIPQAQVENERYNDYYHKGVRETVLKAKQKGAALKNSNVNSLSSLNQKTNRSMSHLQQRNINTFKGDPSFSQYYQPQPQPQQFINKQFREDQQQRQQRRQRIKSQQKMMKLEYELKEVKSKTKKLEKQMTLASSLRSSRKRKEPQQNDYFQKKKYTDTLDQLQKKIKMLEIKQNEQEYRRVCSNVANNHAATITNYPQNRQQLQQFNPKRVNKRIQCQIEFGIKAATSQNNDLLGAYVKKQIFKAIKPPFRFIDDSDTDSQFSDF